MVAVNSDQAADGDESLIRALGPKIAQAEKDLAQDRATYYAAFSRMKQAYGLAETSRRTGVKVSNVKYFALKGENHA